MRRLLSLVSVTLVFLLAACAQQIGTVGYVGGTRISEAEVDRAAAAFAPYGFERERVVLFVVEARAAEEIMRQKGLQPNAAVREAAATSPEIRQLLDDPATRGTVLGVLDFAALSETLSRQGLAIAVADTVKLDPRYGELRESANSMPDAVIYELSGLAGQSSSLSTTAPR
jgi:hypothetical protein